MKLLSLPAFLALATATAAANAQTCGFDDIGPDSASTAGNSIVTSMVPAQPLFDHLIAGTTWTPDFDQTGRVLWAVVGMTPDVDTASIEEWSVAVWASVEEAAASPLAGTYYSRDASGPDYGDLINQIATAGSLNGPAYLVGMDLGDTVFLGGQEYYLAFFVRNDYASNGLVGIVETNFTGPTDYQYGNLGSSLPGWTPVTSNPFSSFDGVLAFRVEAESVVDLGPGCGGLAATPELTVAQGCPTVGGQLDLVATGLTPSTAGAVYASAGSGPAASLGSGCAVYVDLAGAFPVLPLLADAVGGWSGSVPLPASPAVAGQLFTAQGVTFGTAGPLALDLTNGLRFTLSL